MHMIAGNESKIKWIQNLLIILREQTRNKNTYPEGTGVILLITIIHLPRWDLLNQDKFIPRKENQEQEICVMKAMNLDSTEIGKIYFTPSGMNF